MIVCIDGTNQYHVCWHTMGGRGAIDAVLARIAAIQAAWKPEAIVVAFDRPPLFRRDIWPAYKSGRPEREQDLKDNLEALPAAVSKQGIARPAGYDGYEADDVLATVARIGLAARQKVVLVSGDADIRQCLRADWVTIARKLSLAGGKLSAEFVTEESHEAEWGLSVCCWADFLALSGKEPSIPKCPGIGDKTAVALLRGAGSLDTLLSATGAWGPACTVGIRTKLKAWQASGHADICQELVRLRRDVPMVGEAL